MKTAVHLSEDALSPGHTATTQTPGPTRIWNCRESRVCAQLHPVCRECRHVVGTQLNRWRMAEPAELLAATQNLLDRPPPPSVTVLLGPPGPSRELRRGAVLGHLSKLAIFLPSASSAPRSQPLPRDAHWQLENTPGALPREARCACSIFNY